MTKTLGDDVGSHARIEELRAVRVPKIVQPDGRQAEVGRMPPHQVSPPVREEARIDRRTGALTKHEPVIGPLGAQRDPSLQQGLPVLSQDIDDRPVELDGAATGVRLRLLVVDAVETRSDAPADRDGADLEIDVLPAERHELTTPHPGQRCDVPQRGVLVAADGFEERAEFVPGPRRERSGSCRPRARRTRVPRDVHADLPDSQRLGQHLARRDMRGAHGAGSATLGEEHRIRAVEIERTQVLERDRAEHRQEPADRLGVVLHRAGLEPFGGKRRDPRLRKRSDALVVGHRDVPSGELGSECVERVIGFTLQSEAALLDLATLSVRTGRVDDEVPGAASRVPLYTSVHELSFGDSTPVAPDCIGTDRAGDLLRRRRRSSLRS